MATLIISFTPAIPAPSLGYRVLYRKVGDTSYTILSPNWIYSSPIMIHGLDPTIYEGTIQSECVAGIYTIPISFLTPSVTTNCTRWSLTGGTTGTNYRYTACGASSGNSNTIMVAAGTTVNPLCVSNNFSVVNINSGNGIATNLGTTC